MTVIYLTDNSLSPEIMLRCQELLLDASRGIPIVSVSQEPLEFGENVCVGKIGRSWLNLYKQLRAGLLRSRTQYVAIAEHDCVYSEEHFSFRPPVTSDSFYYNDNCWLVQWKGTKPEYEGMYSHWPGRFALSQLICCRWALLRTIEQRLFVLDRDMGLERMIDYLGEPGRSRMKLNKLQRLAESGRSVYLRPLLSEFSMFLEDEKAETFRTKIPNLDIRHSSNFTGPRRGKRRTWDLSPWGRFYEVMNGGGKEWQHSA